MRTRPRRGRTALTSEAYELSEGMFLFLADRYTVVREIGRGVLPALGHAYAGAGKPGKALELLRELDARGRERYVPAYDRAVMYAGLNQIDSALAWLQRAYEERSSWMSYLSVEPRLDPLRSDPRFAMLLRKVGLE